MIKKENLQLFVKALQEGTLEVVKNCLATNQREKYIEAVVNDNLYGAINCRPIHMACAGENPDIVKLLIANNCSIECKTLYDHRPIHYASWTGNSEIVELLIQNKCEIECEDTYKCRPIHYACVYGHINVVKILIKYNCNIECEDMNKQRPIHYSSKYGHILITNILVEKNCEIECEDIEKRRPIHFASKNGHIDIVRFLTQNNCITESLTSARETPIDIAKKRNHWSCVDFLKQSKEISSLIRENSVRNFDKFYKGQIKAASETDNIPSFLDMAMSIKADKIVNYLLDKQIDNSELKYLEKLITEMKMYSSSKFLRESILIRCIRDHHAEGFFKFCSADVVNDRHRFLQTSFIELTAQHGSRAFINQIMRKTVFGEKEWSRAIAIAKEKGFDDIADDIESRREMIMTRLKNKFSLLHTAVCDNDEDMVTYLIYSRIIDANIDHNVFGTALALAHSLCHRKCISVLEKFNVNPNTVNKYMQTPLHEAISSGTLEHCHYLVERCDNINKAGFNNLTALHCAIMKGCADLCEQLIRYGANITEYITIPYLKGMESGTSESRSIFALTSRENSLTLCLKCNRTIYPCLLKSLNLSKFNYNDASDNSLIHLAAACQRPDLCSSLLKLENSVNKINNKGNTCLLELLLNVDSSTIKDNIDKIIQTIYVLLENGANISARSEFDMNAIQHAVQLDDERIMLALSHGKNDVTKNDLSIAFSKKWFGYAEKLLQQCSNSILSTFITKEIIESTLKLSRPSLVKMLFANASQNVQQSIIEEILYTAALNDDENLFSHMIEREILAPKPLSNGDTLFINILKTKKIAFFSKLVSSTHGPMYINLRNNKDQLPVQIAIELGDFRFIEYLIKRTNNINNVDKRGETVLTQIMRRLSSIKEESPVQEWLVLIQPIIIQGGDIYMMTSSNQKVIDLCTKNGVKIQIEKLYRKVHTDLKTCGICFTNRIDGVLQCGHMFCMACGIRLESCPMCHCQSVKCKKI